MSHHSGWVKWVYTILLSANPATLVAHPKLTYSLTDDAEIMFADSNDWMALLEKARQRSSITGRKIPKKHRNGGRLADFWWNA